ARRRAEAAVELVPRLLETGRVDGEVRAGRLAVAAEESLHLLGHALLLARGALAGHRRGVAGIELGDDVQDEGVDLALDRRDEARAIVVAGPVHEVLLRLAHAAGPRECELPVGLRETRGIDRRARALGLAVTAEDRRGLAVRALDLGRAALERGRRTGRLGADRAEHDRCRQRGCSEHRKARHGSTPSLDCALGGLIGALLWGVGAGSNRRQGNVESKLKAEPWRAN